MTYFGTRLSDNLSRREPEGYLICLNVPVARAVGGKVILPSLGKDFFTSVGISSALAAGG